MPHFIKIAQVVIDLDTAAPVSPPMEVVVTRTTADMAVVTFSPQSVGDFQVQYYIADDPSSPDLVRMCVLAVIIISPFITIFFHSICYVLLYCRVNTLAELIPPQISLK